MVHHFTHKVSVSHEYVRISLFEKMIDSHEALLEGITLGLSHDICELGHSFAGSILVRSELKVMDEKLQRRFLDYDGGVRGLALS